MINRKIIKSLNYCCLLKISYNTIFWFYLDIITSKISFHLNDLSGKLCDFATSHTAECISLSVLYKIWCISTSKTKKVIVFYPSILAIWGYARKMFTEIKINCINQLTTSWSIINFKSFIKKSKSLVLFISFI